LATLNISYSNPNLERFSDSQNRRPVLSFLVLAQFRTENRYALFLELL